MRWFKCAALPLVVSCTLPLMLLACQSPIEGGTIITGDVGQVGPPSTKDVAGLDARGGDVSVVPDAADPPGGCEAGAPGTFGCPCSSGGDCESGYCIQGYTEFVCTQRCVDDCPDGYRCVVLASTCPDCEAVCVAELSKNCAPCAVDTDCIAGRCLTLANGQTACADPCDDQNPCGDSFDCVAAEATEGVGGWCKPLNGTCDCAASNAGATRPCTVKNTFGLCAGEEHCDVALGWTACTSVVPSAEVCNGFDDNCNGFADEDVTEGEACQNSVDGVGTCKGATRCDGVAGLVCDGPIPSPETCNGQDDDCDGDTDEDFVVGGLYLSDEHCGKCGVTCDGTIEHAAATTCAEVAGAAACVVVACEDGWAPDGGATCVPTYEGACDSCLQDDDCPAWAQCVTVGKGAFCTTPCGGEGDGPCPPGMACSSSPGDGAGTCQLATGGCATEGKPCSHHWECEDASECSTETCSQGACAFVAVSCDDQNPCTTDTCDAATGCKHEPMVGAACDDGDACTVGDACGADGCVPGAAKPCDDDLACTDDACAAGECVFTPKPTACLVGGVCWGLGDANPQNPCEVCNPLASTTAFVAAVSGAPCDDGEPCTAGDLCQGGACQGGAPLNCGDGNPCTEDTCTLGTGCTYLPQESPCSDALYCTVSDTCDGTECKGQPRDCSPFDGFCAVGTCQEATEGCIKAPPPQGTSCDDGQECTVNDACSGLSKCSGVAAAGCCKTATDCDDKNPCTVDSCEVDTGTCLNNAAAAEGFSCDDGHWCTVTDTCLAGACNGAPRSCASAGDACNTGVCDETLDACTPSPRADGTTCAADATSCTDDVCIAGACTHPPNTEPCNDGVACTFGDVCALGVCAGQPYTCDDGLACTTEACTGAGGCTITVASTHCVIDAACVPADQTKPGAACLACAPAQSQAGWTARPNGAVCSDGNACTQSDACSGGACVGSAPVQCPTPDQCHLASTCDPTTGACPNPPRPNGATCSDGNSCTSDDSCQAGTCVGGPSTCQCQTTADCAGLEDGNACNGKLVCVSSACVLDPTTIVTCAASSDPCQVNSCNPTSGACTAQPAANGLACTDGSACTQSDTCQAGVCAGANPVQCTALDQCHTAGVCNPTTGVCSNPNKVNGSACGDGNACTQTDTCQSGTCVGANPVACAALDQCHDVGTCDPSTGQCSNPAKANGGACSDGNACTQSDTCQAGTCVGGVPITCTAIGQCYDAGTCNPATGICSNPPKANGSACGDGNACTQTDTCQGGTCTGANPVTCSALSQCHDVGTCNPSTGQCSNPAKANGSGCSDGNACTQSDTCQSGSCTGGNTVTCSAQSQCHNAGTCDPSTGQCSNPTKTNGSGCNDGNACTQTDTCQSGSCTGGNTVTCGAQSQCHTAGTCDPATGQCSNPTKTNGSGCNDGNACTQSDTCQSGSCAGGNTVTCSAIGQCYDAGTCNPATGQCSNPTKTNGSGCSDGNACTQSDTCQSGSCAGGNTVTCTALSQCHDAGTCNPSTGQCSNPAKANGSGCSDGNACTQADTCQGGSCAGGSPVTCSAIGQCYDAGTCNPANGQCSNPPKANGSGCSDGNACTQSDTCQGGSCSGGNPVSCNGATQCTEAGTCNTATGACSYPNKPNGTTCFDGDDCTAADKCTNGSCGGTALICNWPNPTCNGDAGCSCGPVFCEWNEGCCGDYCASPGTHCF